MARVLIIGSGPSAAGVALALIAAGRDEIEIVDIGGRLEQEHQELLESVAHQHPGDWSSEVAAVLRMQPLASAPGELPQKRVFGSDFVFRDLGQLAPLAAVPGGNAHPVSSALGGFSNVWGAQVLPFSRATIDQWPIGYEELLPHYRSILDHIPFAGVDDDYAELFPLLSQPDPLPELSSPAAAALAYYRRRRSYVRRRGVTLGAARLAMRGRDCMECGLCMTGCPLGLIYSASQTVTSLAAEGRLSHRAGTIALRVGEDDQGPWALVRDLATGELAKLRTDRLFLACGAVGSTRLMLTSVRPTVRRLELHESVQLVLPFLSLAAHRDPRTYSVFTLNQFNVLVEYGCAGLDLAHFHMYPYNPAFEEALPRPIKAIPGLATQLLRRTVAALGYLPSWASPRLRLDVSDANERELPGVAISATPNPETPRVLREVFKRLLSVAPALDLWPGIPALSISGPAKSYHFGGSFPHVGTAPRAGQLETDRLGRIAEWRRVHMVDGAVLPSVPATTFTLTVMANAHRIASEAVRGQP